MSRYEKKRPVEATERSAVEWAWEFLRRNHTYRMQYKHWYECTQANGELPGEEYSKDLTDVLNSAGGLIADRFRPWLQACFHTRTPFQKLKLWVKSGGEWRESVILPVSERFEGKLIEYSLRSDVRIQVISNTLLDPMTWMLSRWLDPAQPFPKDALGIFDPNATLVPRVEPDTRAFRALQSLGLLDEKIHLGKSIVGIQRQPDEFGVDGDLLTTLISVDIDLREPLAAQLIRLTSIVRTERARITMAGVSDDYFREIKDFDQRGIYSTYIRLLDELDLAESTSPEDLNKEPIGQAIQAEGGTDLRSYEPQHQKLRKNAATAIYLRDRGYRSLAFLEADMGD